MSLFNQAKDRLKDAVGDVAEDNVDGLRNAVVGNVQGLLQDQMEELLGKAVVAAVAAVRDELQTFAALHLATKDDIARLESLIVATGGAGVAVAGTTRAARVPASRPAAAATHPSSSSKARRPRASRS